MIKICLSLRYEDFWLNIGLEPLWVLAWYFARVTVCVFSFWFQILITALKFPNRPDQDLAWYQMNVGPDRYGWPKQLGHLCLSTCYGCVFQRVLKVQMKDIYGHAKQIPNRASLHRPAWDYNPNQNCSSEMKRTQTRSSYWRIIYTSIGRRSVNNQQTKKVTS